MIPPPRATGESAASLRRRTLAPAPERSRDSDARHRAEAYVAEEVRAVEHPGEGAPSRQEVPDRPAPREGSRSQRRAREGHHGVAAGEPQVRGGEEVLAPRPEDIGAAGEPGAL